MSFNPKSYPKNIHEVNAYLKETGRIKAKLLRGKDYYYFNDFSLHDSIVPVVAANQITFEQWAAEYDAKYPPTKNPFDTITETQYHERNQVYCPFCGAEYLAGEYRVSYKSCKACHGYYGYAVVAEKSVEADFKNADRLSIEELDKRTRILAPGYFRSEYRTLWRKKVAEQ